MCAASLLETVREKAVRNVSEQFLINLKSTKWPFQEKLRTFYLTDSGHFRAFLGAYDQNSTPFCKWDYDSIHINDLKVQGDSIIVTRRWGVDLFELRDKHKFD
jgi:hypothetical protein